jgi:3-dehydroquinate synthase
MKAEVFASIKPRVLQRTPVFIRRGLVSDGSFVAQFLQEQACSRHILLSDNKVYKLHGERLASKLQAAGLTISVCLVPSKEASKSFSVYWRLVDTILKERIDKDSRLLTLGGGMVNNLGGFLAATLYRGIRLIHLPSSLLAQLDAAIDLKQAVNHPFGKNLIGSFYSPHAVLVDPQLLETLPRRHLRSGMAEAVKHSLTQSTSFFRYLMENAHRLNDIAFLEGVLRETIRLKLSLMNARNFINHGEFLLQYGHCVGHALETASNYSLLHGDAIAIGMTVSADIARAMGIACDELIEAHKSVFSSYNLPTSIPKGVDVSALLSALSYDKHNSRNRARLALLQKVGKVYKSEAGSFALVGAALLRDSLLRNIEPV